MAVLDSTREQHENNAHRSAVLHRHLHHDFLSLARGEGHYLVMDDGRRIFDASGGAAVACIGVSPHLSLPRSKVRCSGSRLDMIGARMSC